MPNSGLWFNLHLETEDYYANDDPEEEEEELKILAIGKLKSFGVIL